MTTELNRFLDLYKNVAQATIAWVDAAPADVLDWIPDEEEGSRFIDGRGRLSIKTHFIHLVVGDHVQAPQLAECEAGAVLSIFDKALAERLKASSDLIGEADALHQADMAHLQSITDDQMEKTIFRGEHLWTVADYLWSIYSHRAFHIGNMDIYLRAAKIKPPAYYPAIEN